MKCSMCFVYHRPCSTFAACSFKPGCQGSFALSWVLFCIGPSRSVRLCVNQRQLLDCRLHLSVLSDHEEGHTVAMPSVMQCICASGIRAGTFMFEFPAELLHSCVYIIRS